MENENLVTEENVTENVEETTEETINQSEEEVPVIKKDTEETFTKKQVDDMVAKKLARKEAKIRKEYEKKYSGLENVLKAGTGKEDIEDITSDLTDYYRRNGIEIPEVSNYSDEDMKTLGISDADSIINDGYDEVVSEVNRLSNLGTNMSPREKATFEKLANYRQYEEARKELKSKGIGEDILDSKEYKEFTSKLNPNMSEIEKYDMYVKFQPKEAEIIGSMSNKSATGDKGVKDFYTRDEALKFTKEDFDKNPALFKAVENSMLKW